MCAESPVRRLLQAMKEWDEIMDKNMIKSDFDTFGDVEYTTDQKMIRRWIGSHHGHPARLKDAGTSAKTEQSVSVLRIRFPGMPENESRLWEDISWKDFFGTFEAEHLAMEFVNEPGEGKAAPLVRFVPRGTAAADDSALIDPAVFHEVD
jgi:hypothetical protein